MSRTASSDPLRPPTPPPLPSASGGLTGGSNPDSLRAQWSHRPRFCVSLLLSRKGLELCTYIPYSLAVSLAVSLPAPLSSLPRLVSRTPCLTHDTTGRRHQCAGDAVTHVPASHRQPPGQHPAGTALLHTCARRTSVPCRGTVPLGSPRSLVESCMWGRGPG